MTSDESGFRRFLEKVTHGSPSEQEKTEKIHQEEWTRNNEEAGRVSRNVAACFDNETAVKKLNDEKLRLETEKPTSEQWQMDLLTLLPEFEKVWHEQAEPILENKIAYGVKASTPLRQAIDSSIMAMFKDSRTLLSEYFPITTITWEKKPMWPPDEEPPEVANA